MNVLLISVVVFLFAVLLGPVIAGYIYDTTGSYFGAAFTIGIPLLLSSIFLIMMIRTRKQEEYSKLSDDSDEVTYDPHAEVSVQGDNGSFIQVSCDTPSHAISVSDSTKPVNY